MIVEARTAVPADIDELERLYGLLEVEMVDLHRMWPRADGLPGSIRQSLLDAIADPSAHVVIGTLDEVPFGLLLAREELTLDGETIGSIRLVFTEFEARGVGVGEAMRDLALATLRQGGVVRFDAHVLPGHRLAKNFFEAGGFSARSIVMHHDDER